jgi:hypothetical protein
LFRRKRHFDVYSYWKLVYGNRNVFSSIGWRCLLWRLKPVSEQWRRTDSPRKPAGGRQRASLRARRLSTTNAVLRLSRRTRFPRLLPECSNVPWLEFAKSRNKPCRSSVARAAANEQSEIYTKQRRWLRLVEWPGRDTQIRDRPRISDGWTFFLSSRFAFICVLCALR